MRFRTYIRVLGGLTLVVYLALNTVGLLWLMPEAGRLWPFDLRTTGYTVDEAGAFLDQLSPVGRDVYLGPVAWLDTAFPLLLGLFLASLIWRAGRPGLAAVPFAYSAVDLWENAVVARMIVADDPSLAASASNLTQAKFALLALSLAVLWMARRAPR